MGWTYTQYQASFSGSSGSSGYWQVPSNADRSTYGITFSLYGSQGGTVGTGNGGYGGIVSGTLSGVSNGGYVEYVLSSGSTSGAGGSGAAPGGAGSGFASGDGTYAAGGGGGGSGIYDYSSGTLIALAAGGGGGTSNYASGGAGGGTNGNAGGGGAQGGKGGTQYGGGAAGTAGGGSQSVSQTAGTSMHGGTGGHTTGSGWSNGAGGGGGYYGGGGGGAYGAATHGGAGGGGSSYINSSYVSGGYSTSGGSSYYWGQLIISWYVGTYTPDGPPEHDSADALHGQGALVFQGIGTNFREAIAASGGMAFSGATAAGVPTPTMNVAGRLSVSSTLSLAGTFGFAAKGVLLPEPGKSYLFALEPFLTKGALNMVGYRATQSGALFTAAGTLFIRQSLGSTAMAATTSLVISPPPIVIQIPDLGFISRVSMYFASWGTQPGGVHMSGSASEVFSSFDQESGRLRMAASGAVFNATGLNLASGVMIHPWASMALTKASETIRGNLGILASSAVVSFAAPLQHPDRIDLTGQAGLTVGGKQLIFVGPSMASYGFLLATNPGTAIRTRMSAQGALVMVEVPQGEVFDPPYLNVIGDNYAMQFFVASAPSRGDVRQVVTRD